MLIPGLRIMKQSDPTTTAGAGAAAAAAGGAGGSAGGAAAGAGGGPGSAGGAGAKAAVVGDGGLSWRLKALARAKARAAEEGSSLAAVVSQRHGSLSSLTATLTGGRAADGEYVCVLCRGKLRRPEAGRGSVARLWSAGQPDCYSD